MRRVACLTVLVVLAVTQAARAALAVGEVAPDFSASATTGGKEFRFTLSEALTKGPVVLYFYPAAFTAGCSAEAHEFASAIDRYKALGASVIGVSGDTIETLNKFSVSDCQSKFPLAADTDRKIMKAYDFVLIPFTSYASRTSYVITPDSHVLYVYTALDPSDHVTNTFNALAAWRARHPAE